jgi:hypothetical protein
MTGISAQLLSMAESRKIDASLYISCYPSHLDPEIPNGETIQAFTPLLPLILDSKTNQEIQKIQQNVSKLAETLHPRKNDMFI